MDIYGCVCFYKREIKRAKRKIQKRVNVGKVLKIIRHARLDVEVFKINLNVYTGDAKTTAILTGIIKAGIPIIIRIFNVTRIPRAYEVCINPVFNKKYYSKNVFKCILSQNVVHIIIAIFRSIMEWRSENYGRKASHRGAYGHGYE